VRDDTFETPIVRAMNRTNPKERARQRVLGDEEIKALWSATETGGTFGALVRFMLLSGQRKAKCATLRWDDIGDDGVWHVRPDTELAAREKGSAGALPLSSAALAAVRSQPQVKGNEHVFSGRGAGPYKAFSVAKRRLDEKMLGALRESAVNRGDDPGKVELERWTLHDLRRSARSAMSRAKVPPHIAEITLGHVQKGIVQIYDRYTYESEKKQALDSLAAIVERIVHPPDNVIPIREAVE
jgi:integrase